MNDPQPEGHHGKPHRTTKILSHAARRRGGGVAARDAGAAAGDAGCRISWLAGSITFDDAAHVITASRKVTTMRRRDILAGAGLWATGAATLSLPAPAIAQGRRQLKMVTDW